MKCYACDSEATGWSDRYSRDESKASARTRYGNDPCWGPHPACERHAIHGTELHIEPKGVKATLYYVSEWGFGFGVSSHEVTVYAWGRRSYAQFDTAPYAEFKPKRARKMRGLSLGSHDPYLLLVKGWDHGKGPSAFETVKDTSEVLVAKSKYTCFDPAHESDFDAWAEEKSWKVLADYRAKDRRAA